MFIWLWLHYQYNDVQPCNFPVFIYNTHQDSHQRKLTFMMEGIQGGKFYIHKGRFTCPIFRFSRSKPQKIIILGESWIFFSWKKDIWDFCRRILSPTHTTEKCYQPNVFTYVCYNAAIAGYKELFFLKKSLYWRFK